MSVRCFFQKTFGEKMRKKLLALFLVFTILLPSAAFAQKAVKLNGNEKRMAETITAEQLKQYLYFVASDEMEGRDTPSRGLDLTAKFIALMLERWKFKPAGDNGTFFQKIALNANVTDDSTTSFEIGGQKLNYGKDFYANSVTGSATNSPLVFAGNGWFVKAKNIDAFAGLDVKDKTVVVYSEGDYPEGVTREDLFSGNLGRFGVDVLSPQIYARMKGAAGLIVVASNDVESRWDGQRKEAEKGRATVEKFASENSGRQRGGRNVPTIVISKETAAKLFQGEAKMFTDISASSANSSFALNKTVSYTVATKALPAMTQNVVAVWEGSDPVLKNEYVAIGAHYDHVGMNPNAPGADKIWNGADDDGSGTVSVLSIAEALAKAKTRPKRSVLFVWHCGEEKGLWGSAYFNKFPTVDIKKVVAQLNIDMIGRSRKTDDTNPKNAELSGENEVYVIGAEMMSSTLGAITKGTNDSYLKLGYDFRYDDPKDPNRFFFRSDHFNYAHNGIPIVFWFDGVHEDYHQPGDEPQKIDYQKMEKVARTIFLTLWEITALKQRPAVDKQLPKELTER